MKKLLAFLTIIGATAWGQTVTYPPGAVSSTASGGGDVYAASNNVFTGNDNTFSGTVFKSFARWEVGGESGGVYIVGADIFAGGPPVKRITFDEPNVLNQLWLVDPSQDGNSTNQVARAGWVLDNFRSSTNGAFDSLTLGGSNVMTRSITVVSNTDIRATTPAALGDATYDVASNTLFIAGSLTTNGYIKFVGAAVP